jgi:prepilin-type N-terminal cleavage/methylation domain-containing protein
MNRGFTVVEILVTLVVLSILLTLGVVGLQSSLAHGRDSERKSDIETLARGFERFYEEGLDGSIPGSYPSYNELWNTTRPWRDFSFGSSDSAFRTPTNGSTELVCIFKSPSPYWSTESGCEAPANLVKIKSELSPDKYGYEATQNGGTVHCYAAGDCTGFNLYWIDEVTGDVKVLKSKHR